MRRGCADEHACQLEAQLLLSCPMFTTRSPQQLKPYFQLNSVSTMRRLSRRCFSLVRGSSAPPGNGTAPIGTWASSCCDDAETDDASRGGTLRTPKASLGLPDPAGGADDLRGAFVAPNRAEACVGEAASAASPVDCLLSPSSGTISFTGDMGDAWMMGGCASPTSPAAPALRAASSARFISSTFCSKLARRGFCELRRRAARRRAARAPPGGA